MPDDYRRDRQARRGQTEQFSAGGSREPTLREPDPAGSETLGTGSEHQILCRQRTVLDGPLALPDARDEHDYRCAVEDIEARLPYQRASRWAVSIPAK